MAFVVSIANAFSTIKALADHEYEAAKAAVAEVLRTTEPCDPDRPVLFRDAMNRQEQARERLIRALRA